jgi:hypothetical protein
MTQLMSRPMRVTIEPTIPPYLVSSFYDLYVAAFGPLRTRAAARQVLTLHEFAQEMTDPRVDKYVVWDVDARGVERAVALTTFTNDLSTVPWIEPAYYAHRYPEHYARGAVFYLGFTLVDPGLHLAGVFSMTVGKIVERLVEERAVCAWDICAHNDTVLQLGAGIERIITRMAEVTVGSIDVQTYYASMFHGPKQPS